MENAFFILRIFLAIISLINESSSILYFSKINKTPTTAETYLIADEGQPFQVECMAEENDFFHPGWYFTRDKWFRDPMDQSLIVKGYDNTLTGLYTTTLSFEDVRIDDFGFYECLSEDQQRVLKSFNLYINSTNLLLPVPRGKHIIMVNAGSTVHVPCHLLNPTNADIKVNLISLSTGYPLPNVIKKESNEGFEIQNARLPDHNGEVECVAETSDGRQQDSVKFFLSFSSLVDPSDNGGGGVDPPPTCQECYALPVPHIVMHNEHDIHAGDDVVMNCSVIVPKSFEDKIELEWLILALTEEASNHELIKKDVEGNSGYTELIMMNIIKKIKTNGPFRCTASLRDEEGRTVEARSATTNFNLIFFDTEDPTIEWHKDAFNQVIHVKEGQPVKWVIGFTVHKKDHQILSTPLKYDFVKVLRPASRFRDRIRTVERETNRFTVTMELDHVTIDDMGTYELRIIESGTTHRLEMALYVQAEPYVELSGGNKNGYYKYNESLDMNCSIKSYPINETSIEIKFLNCTTTEECTLKSATEVPFTAEGEEGEEAEAHKDDAYGAKSDNRGSQISTNNGYSEAVNIPAIADVHSGFLICKACNTFGCTEQSAAIFITDLDTDEGILLKGPSGSIVEGETFSLSCAASKLQYSQVSWGLGDGYLLQEDKDIKIDYWETDYSLGSNISIESGVKDRHSGTFFCSAQSTNYNDKRMEFPLEIRPLVAPKISNDQNVNTTRTIQIGQDIPLSCGTFTGDPPPTLNWSKDDQDEVPRSTIAGPDPSGAFYNYTFRVGNGNRTLYLIAGNPLSNVGKIEEEKVSSLEGKYVCTASNRGGTMTSFQQLELKTKETDTKSILAATLGSVFTVIAIALFIFVGFYFYHKNKLESEKSKYSKILDTFKMGDPEGLEALRRRILLNHGIETENVTNEECSNLISGDMGEFQKPKNAQMLPYDEEKWEVAFENLSLKEIIGEGHFGKVCKGKMLSTNGPGLTVAVKMLHSNPERSTVENLMSELKIMIHLGSHPNIVNVLGACTTKLRKQELYVMVEYCEHGDIVDVLRKHKQAFRRKTLQMQRAESRAQMRPGSNSAAVGFPSKTRTISTSSSIHSMLLQEEDEKDEELDEEDGRRQQRMEVVLESAEAAAHYRPMMQRPRTDTIREKITLTMSKLISWSEQVANGMDYLSSKKVVHGDLACRNILLARNNVVKISDFGLSKYVEYKDYYKNEKSRPLPIKWLSLETIRDGVYTIQSDVWSYGVVLWELFSLGDTPYPGVEIANVRNMVLRGLRLARPEHALDGIYEIMKSCQNDDPDLRPTFFELKKSFQRLGSEYKMSTFSGYGLDSPEPRAAFANSLYFNQSETSGEQLGVPEGADGYLLPSPKNSTFTFSSPNDASTLV